MPPTLVQAIKFSEATAELQDRLAQVYRRAVDRKLPEPESRDFVSHMVKHLSASRFAVGVQHGIETAMAELRSASTYALYWAMVPFMPPQRAAWLHQLYFALTTADHPAELQQALLELAQLLATVPAEDLPALAGKLRQTIRETLGREEQTRS